MSGAHPSITLYSARTPNGFKISIALKEMALDYRVRALDLAAREQKQPSFSAINPNGRIPAIVDHDAGDHAVFESGAILVYLAEKSGALLPRREPERSTVLEWLLFQVGGVGPMMGQANVFTRYVPTRIEYAIERYRRESRRLLQVLDQRLQRQPWLASEYSIADIANFAWARTHDWSGTDVQGLDALKGWMQRIAERPAVARGLAIPPSEGPVRDEELADMARKMLV